VAGGRRSPPACHLQYARVVITDSEAIMRTKAMTIAVALLAGAAVASTSMVLTIKANKTNAERGRAQAVDHATPTPVADERYGQWRYKAGPKHPIY